MKAMIFAAGLGTRLKPFTDSHPKALAEICGHPMLGIVIRRLIAAGVDEVVVNVHHFADQIVEYLRKNDNFGITIHISDETAMLLDTGGGILAARKWLDGDDRFIVHNADILTDVNLSGMAAFADRSEAMASLLVADRSTKRYLLFDPDDMRMRGWTNVSTGEYRPGSLTSADGLRRLAFGGVHVLSPDIFPHLEQFARSLSGSDAIPKFSIMDFYVSRCSGLPFFGYCPHEAVRWHDIGKPESLAAAQEDFEVFFKHVWFTQR